MKRLARFSGLLAVALAALLLLPPAQAQQKLLPAQSEIGFVSRQMGAPVEGRFRSFEAQVTLGTFSLKGRGRALTVPVALTQSGGITTATGAFTIKRLDFKVGDGDWADTDLIANDVQVKFKLALSGVAAL